LKKYFDIDRSQCTLIPLYTSLVRRPRLHLEYCFSVGCGTYTPENIYYTYGRYTYIGAL